MLQRLQRPRQVPARLLPLHVGARRGVCVGVANLATAILARPRQPVRPAYVEHDSAFDALAFNCMEAPCPTLLCCPCNSHYCRRLMNQPCSYTPRTADFSHGPVSCSPGQSAVFRPGLQPPVRVAAGARGGARAQPRAAEDIHVGHWAGGGGRVRAGWPRRVHMCMYMCTGAPRFRATRQCDRGRGQYGAGSNPGQGRGRGKVALAKASR